MSYSHAGVISGYSYLTVADFMRDIKRSTSLMMKQTRGFEQFFGWARRYSCDTVSFHYVDVVKQYIINQKEHHKTIDLADELKMLFDEDVDEHSFD